MYNPNDTSGIVVEGYNVVCVAGLVGARANVGAMMSCGSKCRRGIPIPLFR